MMEKETIGLHSLLFFFFWLSEKEVYTLEDSFYGEDRDKWISSSTWAHCDPCFFLPAFQFNLEGF